MSTVFDDCPNVLVHLYVDWLCMNWSHSKMRSRKKKIY